MKTLAIKMLTIPSLVLVLLGSGVPDGIPQQAKPLRSLPMPEAQLNGPSDSAQGNLWLSWPADRQLGYVQGLLEGSFWGYTSACTQAEIAAPSLPKLNGECMKHIPAAGLRPEAYVAVITEFYSKYSEDRALPIHRLLIKLLEPGMTADGVHKWLDELVKSSKQRSHSK